MSEVDLSPEAQRRFVAETAAPQAQAAVAGCACTLFAIVTADGKLARGLGAMSSTKIRPQSPEDHNIVAGQYEVIFNRDVSNCAYTATIGLSGSASSSAPGEITVAGDENDPKKIFITTYDIQGVGINLGFHLTVHCPPT